MFARFARQTHIFEFLILAGLLLGGVMTLTPSLVLAQTTQSPGSEATNTGASTGSASSATANTPKGAQSSGGSNLTIIDKVVEYTVIPVINAFTSFFAWIAGMAASLFVWVVNPANISGPTGILNTPAVYNMWKFIRDFFNLFFILILLLSAFATIFQVENFSIRKIFLNILFAALIINFSFPITRFLVDLTNVPMYYFLNAILPDTEGGLGFVKVFLGSSGLGAIPMAAGANIIKALSGLIFMFLFSISLLVLGVMLFIRLIALTLLLIFSPFGFAASLLPGFQKYGHSWWESFWKYAFFGPSAALVLLVAVRFLEQVSLDGTYGRIRQGATNMTAGGPEASIVATMIFYLIPLILIWTAIGMANKASIAGADKVVGMGYGAARWAGKKTGKLMMAPAMPVIRGVKEGAKEGLKSGKWFGADLKKIPGGKFLTGKYYKQAGENREAAIKGRITGGSEGRKNELAKLHAQRINEAVKKNKENQVSRSALQKDLGSSDEVARKAAALSMAEAGEIRTSEDLRKAIVALHSSIDKNGQFEFDQSASDMVLRVIDKAKDGATAGISHDLYDLIAKSKGGYVRDARGNFETNEKGERMVGSTLEALDSKLKKDGNLHVKVEYKIKEEIAESAAHGVNLSDVQARNKVYDKFVQTLSADDLVNQTRLHEQNGFVEYFKEKVANEEMGVGRVEAILKKANEKGKPSVQSAWNAIAGNRSPAEAEQNEARRREVEANKEMRERMQRRKAETRQRRAG